MRIIKLESDKQVADGCALEGLVFNTPHKAHIKYLSYGVYDGATLVAVTRVNTDPLRDLKVGKPDSAASEIKAILEEWQPEIAISATVVHADYRQQGVATELKRFLQTRYTRIQTGISWKSSREIQQRTNLKLGFKKVWARNGSSIWIWVSDIL
jgi:GNAT superfamily N-acetyltransferase